MKHILALIVLLAATPAYADTHFYNDAYRHHYYPYHPYYRHYYPPVVVIPAPPTYMQPQPTCQYGTWQDAYGRYVNGTACLYPDGWHLR